MKANHTSTRKHLQKHLEKALHLAAQGRTIKKYRSDEALIAAVRKTREELWNQKLAART